MSIRSVAVAAAAFSLAAAPVAAQAAPADRASAPVVEGNEAGRTSTFAIIAALIIVALAVLVATNNGNDPQSP